MKEKRLKRRVIPHLMEEESLAIVRDALPKHWVIRNYKPDYGLDLSIETFTALPDDETTFQTLAEHFFVQLKSVATMDSQTLQVPPRLNVAKYPNTEVSNVSKDPTYSVDVIPFRIDTALLNTIQAMGASVVVHLFLTVLDTRRVFYLCLTDYIDKVLLPQGGSFDHNSTLIQIPLTNELSSQPQHEQALAYVRFFAKRAKFYSAFNLFAYQRHELEFCEDFEARRKMASHFIGLLRNLDIWHESGWPIVDDYRRWLFHLDAVLPSIPDYPWFNNHPWRHSLPATISDGIPLDFLTDQQILQFWNGLNVLGRNYEEVCREFALPTYFELLRTS